MSAIWTSTVTGERHELNAHPINAPWYDVPGVYWMANLVGARWHPHYIGKADSFRDRLAGHERWPDAVASGATHILAEVIHDEWERNRVEKLMIAQCNPKLNTQFRTDGAIRLADARGLRPGLFGVAPSVQGLGLGLPGNALTRAILNSKR